MGSGKSDKYSVRHWQVTLHFADERPLEPMSCQSLSVLCTWMHLFLSLFSSRQCLNLDCIVIASTVACTPPLVCMFSSWEHSLGSPSHTHTLSLSLSLISDLLLYRTHPWTSHPRYTVFHSQMDFVKHTIWLMCRKVGQCLCKYCMPGQDQLDINVLSRR